MQWRPGAHPPRQNPAAPSMRPPAHSASRGTATATPRAQHFALAGRHGSHARPATPVRPIIPRPAPGWQPTLHRTPGKTNPCTRIKRHRVAAWQSHAPAQAVWSDTQQHADADQGSHFATAAQSTPYPRASVAETPAPPWGWPGAHPDQTSRPGRTRGLSYSSLNPAPFSRATQQMHI